MPECNSKWYQYIAVKFELAATTLWLMFIKNKTAEEEDIDKLGKLCSERKAYEKKWLTLCLSSRRMCITCICTTYVPATGIEV